MKASAPCQSFIKGFETLRLTAYLPTPDDVWTIGWGHTGPDVYEGLTITLETADLLFLADLAKFEHGVERLVKVPLSQGQFDALVSFAFNVGFGRPAGNGLPEIPGFETSTLLKYLNSGHYEDSTGEFLRWDKQAGHVLAGLQTRRRAEMDMFLRAA